MPKKPGGCNRNHIPKVLEHPTGLPNLQPSYKSPTPGSPQAPFTLEPDSSAERKQKPGGGGGNREGTLRTAKQLKFEHLVALPQS